MELASQLLGSDAENRKRKQDVEANDWTCICLFWPPSSNLCAAPAVELCTLMGVRRQGNRRQSSQETHAQIPSPTSVPDTLMSPEITWTIQRKHWCTDATIETLTGGQRGKKRCWWQMLSSKTSPEPAECARGCCYVHAGDESIFSDTLWWLISSLKSTDNSRRYETVNTCEIPHLPPPHPPLLSFHDYYSPLEAFCAMPLFLLACPQ